jgi:hypothetical protein
MQGLKEHEKSSASLLFALGASDKTKGVYLLEKLLRF